MLDNSKFYGQFDPPVDKFIFYRYFSNCSMTGVTLECGSYDGIAESCCYFFEKELNWKAVNIEASPPIFEQLCVNRPRSLNLNLALSDREGVVEFRHAVHPRLGVNFGNGSVQHSPEHLMDLQAQGCTFQHYAVPAKTYRQLVEEQRIERIDLMVLDVEGHEAAVFRGMQGAAVLPGILCVEVGHVGLEPTRQQLEPMGYVFDTQSFVNAFFVRQDLVRNVSISRS